MEKSDRRENEGEKIRGVKETSDKRVLNVSGAETETSTGKEMERSQERERERDGEMETHMTLAFILDVSISSSPLTFPLSFLTHLISSSGSGSPRSEPS